MTITDEVKQLVFAVPSPPGEDPPRGTDDDTITEFDGRTGLRVPTGLREWLRFTNGPCIGPGGLLGIRPDRTCLDIEEVLESYPAWREKGWLPIAADGCGNYYVVNTNEGEAVYFIDAAANSEGLDYAVASNVWRFLWFLLEREMGKKDWPFSRDFVLSVDPDIVRCAAAPLPWNA